MRKEPGALRRLGARLCAVVLSASLASGCTAVRTVSPTASGYEGALRAGDRVRVFRHDGTVLDLFVTDVRDDALAGELDLRGRDVRDIAAPAPVVIPLAAIARIERYEISRMRTAVFAGAVAVAAVIVTLFAVGMNAWTKSVEQHGGAAPALPAR